MWKLSVELPARWITWTQALDYLGVAENALKSYVKAGLIQTRGGSTGYRLNAEHVVAVGILAQLLEPVLKLSEESNG